VQVEHTEDDHFIINSASLHNAQLHHRISDLFYPPISPEEWVRCIAKGMQVWSAAGDAGEELYEDSNSEDEEVDGDSDDDSDDSGVDS
jgi:hypothetical protein